MRNLILSALLLASLGTLGACGGGGSGSSNSAVPIPTPPTPGLPSSFNGNIILGAPTDTAVALKLFSPDQAGTAYVVYGSQAGVYDQTTSALALTAAQPLGVSLTGLLPNTAYFYRVDFQPSGGVLGAGQPYAFHTARPAGSSFTFTIQADSHLDENSSLDQYHLTLANVLSDKPDFHIDLGDTFMTEKHTQAFDATVQAAADQATVNRRYQYEREHFGRFAHSVPLFLVNGNHDGELGWLNTGSAQVLPVWATLARTAYFLNPTPGAFYRGDSKAEQFVGQRAAWYAWQWGDALFVALDPYWNSTVQASKDGWNLTLGKTQYDWLADTLSTSTAKYKFVFIHNLVGGLAGAALDGQMRGGVEAAPNFEWGGKNADGTEGFSSKRFGWGLPIHQLLVKNKVTAVFHGHDHLYAKQSLDGVVYQEVPQPSAKNNNSGGTLALAYQYNSGTIASSSGHMRITVAPSSVTAEYVRSWLPQSENAVQKNGQIADRWTVSGP